MTDYANTHTTDHTDERICIITFSLSYQSQIKRYINKTLINIRPGEDLLFQLCKQIGL